MTLNEVVQIYDVKRRDYMTVVFDEERIETLKKDRIRLLKMGMDEKTIGGLFIIQNGFKFKKFGFGWNLLNLLNEEMMSSGLKREKEV